MYNIVEAEDEEQSDQILTSHFFLSSIELIDFDLSTKCQTLLTDINRNISR